MNAVANAQHRRLGHLHAQSLDILRKRDSNGITFEGAVSDCDVSAVGKAQQLAHSKRANHKVNRPFQLWYGDLMVPFTPVAIGSSKYVSKVNDEYTKWTAVYLLTKKNQALPSLELFVGSTVIPFGGRIVRWRAKSGENTGEEFRQYCLGTSNIQAFAATNTPQQISVSKRVGRTLCAIVRCMLADSGSWRLRTSRIRLRTRRSRWRRHSRCLTARKSTSRAFASSEPEPSCTSRTPESSTPRSGKGKCAAIARRANIISLKPKDSPRHGKQERHIH